MAPATEPQQRDGVESNRQTHLIEEAGFKGNIGLKKGKVEVTPPKAVTHDEGEVRKG